MSHSKLASRAAPLLPQDPYKDVEIHDYMRTKKLDPAAPVSVDYFRKLNVKPPAGLNPHELRISDLLAACAKPQKQREVWVQQTLKAVDRIDFVTRGSVNASRHGYPSWKLLVQRFTTAFPTLTGEHVKALAKDILTRDERFAGDIGETLKRVKEEVGASVSPIPLGWLQKRRIRAAMTHDLVCMVERPPEFLYTSSDIRSHFNLRDTDKAPSYEQTFNHVYQDPKTGWFSIIGGSTLSSVTIKDDQKVGFAHAREYNANSAAIISDAGKLIAWRSGRSDTPKKLEEKVVGMAAAALTAAKGDMRRASGFVEVAKDTWEFHPVIVTALDRSILKKWVSFFLGFFEFFLGRQEDETEFLKNLDAAPDSLFPDGIIKRIVELPVVIDGQVQPIGSPQEVTIRKPPVIGIALSGVSAHSGSIIRQRVGNEKAAALLFGELARVWSHRPSTTAAAFLAQIMQDADNRAKAGDSLPLRRFFDDLTKGSRFNDVLAQLSDENLKDRLALDYLCLNMRNMNASGATTNGNKMLRRDDTSVELHLAAQLFDLTSYVPGVECKSGADRTPQEAGVFITNDQFTRLAGQVYEPDVRAADKSVYSKMFTDALNTFTMSLVKLIRGVLGKPKWSGHWGMQRYYLPNRH